MNAPTLLVLSALLFSLVLEIIIAESSIPKKTYEITKQVAFHKLQGLAADYNKKKTLKLEELLNKRRTLGEREYEFLPFALYKEKCQDELTALKDNPEDEAAIEAVIACFQEALNELIEPCLENFPGVFNPLKCLIGLNFEEPSMEDFSDIDSDNYIQRDLSRVVISELTNEALDENQCRDIFGDAEDPSILGCLSLFEKEDLKKFLDQVEKDFEDFEEDCKVFQDFEIFEDVYFKYDSGFDTFASGDNENILRKAFLQCDSDFGLGLNEAISQFGQGTSSARAETFMLSAVASITLTTILFIYADLD